MNKISSVEDLEVFKKAHSLTLKMYQDTQRFPKEEKFGLISQIRRSAVSICANLMEGAYRNNKKEYRQFVGISHGSAGELKYYMILSKDLGYLSSDLADFYLNEIVSIIKMLKGLINSLSQNIK